MLLPLIASHQPPHSSESGNSLANLKQESGVIFLLADSAYFGVFALTLPDRRRQHTSGRTMEGRAAFAARRGCERHVRDGGLRHLQQRDRIGFADIRA